MSRKHNPQPKEATNVTRDAFAQYHNPTPQEAMTYALARADEYARSGDVVLSRAMLACYAENKRRLALAVTRATPVSIPLDSGDRRGV